jgi:hypothetical protein
LTKAPPVSKLLTGGAFTLPERDDMSTEKYVLLPQVSVTFRMSEEMRERLSLECGHCGCNISAFIRAAVLKEIANRRAARAQAASHAILSGQIDVEGKVHA